MLFAPWSAPFWCWWWAACGAARSSPASTPKSIGGGGVSNAGVGEAMNQIVRPECADSDRRLRLSARLSLDLRARGRAARRAHHRPRARRRGQRLHGRRDLRQGRALRRARPSSRPPDAPAAAQRRQGLGRIRAGFLGRCARSGCREFLRAEQRYGPRGGLALLLCGHDGPRHARRHQPPAPRQELFRLLRDDLHQSGLGRLRRRHRQARRPRSARDGEVRPGRDLGHQSRSTPRST